MPRRFFQPGIVIFADTAGKAIYDSIRSRNRLETINAPLTNAIGFIFRNESGDGPVYTFRYAKDEERDAEIEKKAALKDAVLELKENLHPPSSAGDYKISEGFPVIYIIGLPSSHYIVNDLRAEGIWDAEIKCLFLCEPGDQLQIISEEWEKWKENQQVIPPQFFGNVSAEDYKKLGKSKFEDEVVEALFDSLSPREIGPTADEIDKRIQVSVRSQMAAIRKRVSRRQTRTQEILKKRRSRSRRVHTTGQGSIIEQLPWFPLAACQEDTFQGEQPANYENLRNVVLQQTKTFFQHIEGAQDFSERWVERFSKRQREALETLTTIGEKLEEIWDCLEKDTLRKLGEAIKQIEAEGSLWVEDYCEQMQLELEVLYKQIESEDQSDASHVNNVEQIRLDLNADSNEEQAQNREEEKLRSDIKERVYMTPSFRTFSVMAVVVALILALQVWLFASAFTKIPLLLLPLDFVFCLVLLVTGCRLYYKKTYIVPLEEKQKRMIVICKDELVERCKQIEKEQRLAFIKKVESGLEELLVNLSRSDVAMSPGESVVRELAALNEVEEKEK